MGAGFASQDRQNIVEGNLDHILDSLIGEKSNVRGHDDIGQGQQGLNWGGQGRQVSVVVLVKNGSFPFDRVKRRGGDCMLLERCDQGGCVNDGSPAGVDQAGIWLH